LGRGKEDRMEGKKTRENKKKRNKDPKSLETGGTQAGAHHCLEKGDSKLSIATTKSVRENDRERGQDDPRQLRKGKNRKSTRFIHGGPRIIFTRL